jgi:hypothetical protein
MNSLLLVAFLLVIPIRQDKLVEVVYVKEAPSQLHQPGVFHKVSNDFLDRAEFLLKEVERDLIQMAASGGYGRVEIFLIEKQNGEIPTESQMGKKGYVKLMYIFKKTN